jgi:glycosylphosphatidylinositol phospholipase D
MDFIIDLSSSNSYDSILVVVDFLTNMAHFIPYTKTINDEGTTKLFLDHVFRYQGLPENIISNHGLQFASKFWK